MKVGLIPAFGGGIQGDGAYVAAVAREAENAGFDSLWVGEHVVLPVHARQAYPGSREGLQAPSTEPLPDPLDWLAFAAGCTSTLLLGTAVLLAPLHHPLILAKRIATLDRLSGGRVLLGVGIGWNEQEYEQVGVEFRTRGKRMDDTIGALRELWTDDQAEYHGEFVDFEPVYSAPKPVQNPLPVLIGGDSDAAAKRAGRLGNGFLPFERDYDRLARAIEIARTAASDAGRDPDELEITCLGSVSRARVEKLAALGVHRILLFLSAREPESIAVLGERARVAVESL
ncbi:MAG: LLM class F420-dependent oxidoreductase [Acidimicrobiia bacterium]